MSNPVVDRLSRGMFVFLRPGPGEIRRVLPQADTLLPVPQRIYLEDESAEPRIGFPVLTSRPLSQLAEAALEYLSAEEEAQLATLTRSTFDSRAYQARWELYHSMLRQALENTLVSSIGVDYTAIFWLHHSLTITDRLKQIPRRLRQQDPALGRDHGDAVKYRVFDRWSDRIGVLHHELGAQLSEELGVAEDVLFPELFALMRDNVLVFTEDYVGPDLSEMTSYFKARLGIDGRTFRRRFAALVDWHDLQVASDPVLRSTIENVLGMDPSGDPRRALHHPGYVVMLQDHPRYDASHLFDAHSIDLWRDLLLRLQRFELLHALRKMVVPLEREDDGSMVCRDRTMNTTWVGGPPVLRLSRATRPMDFTAPWVVNPVVQRYGLVYDITEFSQTLSMLGRSERSALETAFRMTVQFQRKIDLIAGGLNIRLEKYLGDGAFYSARNSRRMLQLAIHIQDLYPQFVKRGFRFDRGLRIALNLGEYRLLPLELAEGEINPRYEYFGHGLVELSRLTTGKKTQQVDAFRTYLVSQGYPEANVNRFFAPLMQRNAELVSTIDESRDFFAYINATNTLINEGIVATEPFIESLGDFDTLYYARDQGRGFIAIAIDDGESEPMLIGIRKLGSASFKGLDSLAIYEITNGQSWDRSTLTAIPPQPLLTSLERLFNKTVSAARARQAAG